MESSNLFSLFTLAFGLGLLHALDADHVMAISGLMNTGNNARNGIRFCLRWAIGHGITLLTIGCCVLVMGMTIPHQLSHYAEYAVGGLLIVIGVWLCWALSKTVSLHNTASQSRGNTANPHDAIAATVDTPRQPSSHAMLVGILHGIAGSAPLLLLISLANIGSALSGLVYILLFSIGVLCAMLLFGGLLTRAYRWLAHWGTPLVLLTRLLIAIGAIVLGINILLFSH